MLHRLSELPASQCGSWELCLSTTYLLNPLKHIMPADLNASMSCLVCSYPKDLYSKHVLPCFQVPQDL